MPSVYLVHEYSVGDVARLTGVTVRALHHYDEIGLVRPSGRTRVGYRQYGDDDLDRLHRVLGYRELGFGLSEIAEILDEQTDMGQHLVRQLALLNAHIERLQKLAANVERNLEAYMTGINLSPQERFDVFGVDDPSVHAAEVETRWGDTDAYRESRRRTSTYSKAQWLEIRSEGDAIQQHIGVVFASGARSDSTEAMDAVEKHRTYIDTWFYPISAAMHRNLGDLYTDDERFAATYEAIAPGLARWVRDAIGSNADRADYRTSAE